VTEAGGRTVWSSPEGSVEHDQSVKDYAVEATDGSVGTVSATPTHEAPDAPVDWGYVDQFERGMLGGGFVWPYTDV